MTCRLCNKPLTITETMRPNHATFECGHAFHLSCVIQYSKEKITNSCPTCAPPTDTFFADFGDDRLKTMCILIDKRRQVNKIEKPKSFFSLFGAKNDLRSMVQSGTNLHTLKLNGYLPESFVEDRVRYRELSGYQMDSLIHFGFRFDHFVEMGFQPEDFAKMTPNHMDELEITAADMLKTSIDIFQLADLNIELYKLCEMQWKWHDLTRIGGNCQTIRLLTPNMSELKTYFEPTLEDYQTAGFNEEAMKKYEYNVDYNPFGKRKVARKKNFHINSRNILF